jgi:prepilin-type processing-associated H-X9-DG protein
VKGRSTLAQRKAQKSLNLENWPKAAATLEKYVARQSAWTLRSLSSELATADTLSAAADDYANRIEKLVPEMRSRIATGNLPRAQFVAGQVFQLARLAEQRLVVATERKHAALLMADGHVEQAPDNMTFKSKKARAIARVKALGQEE